MFHRVKSEVQDNGQKNQTQQGVAVGYKQDEAQVVSQEQEHEIEVGSVSASSLVTPSYEIPSTLSAQKETKAMEDTAVQGKYARETEARNDSPVTGYARPGQAPIARPSAAYPGAYSAPSATLSAPSYTPVHTPDYSAVAPSSAAAAAAAMGDRCLRIGRGINMSGEIEACDHLLVEGTVEAALKGAKVLEIAESGTFYGTVEIEEATIAGRFEGDITVNGRLTIRASGTITGSISYRELEVEAGAMVDGRMTPLKGVVEARSADQQYRSASDASAMTKAKDLVSKKEPANVGAAAEHALFSKAHAGR